MRPSALPLTARFWWKLVPAALIVAAGDWLFYREQYYGGQIGLFALAILGAMLAARPALRRDRRAWAAMAGAALFAFALVREPSLLAMVLFWIAASMATLLPATAWFDDGWRWTQRLAWQGARAPFGPLIDARRWLKVRAAGRSGRWTLHGAMALTALPILGSALILSLFAAANPLLEQLLSGLLVWELSPALIGRCLLWALLTILIWSLLRPRLTRWLLPSRPRRGDIALPGVSLSSVTLSLIVFNLLFALQNGMDLAYLWHLAPLPHGMTMADYAHRGAYPLIVTALLVALFVLVTLRPGSDMARAPAVRRLVMLWIGQNIFLVGSAMLRTVDYIEAYSLTRLRIAALLWMGLVAFGLAAICWRALRGRSAAWLINVNLAAAGLVMTGVCFADLGAIAAAWNVRHAREVGGQGVPLDLCYLGGLEDSALLPLLALEGRADLRPGFRERVHAVRIDLLSALEQDQYRGWTMLGQARLAEAQRLLAGRRPLKLPQGARDCTGGLVPASAPPPSAPLPRALTGEGGK